MPDARRRPIARIAAGLLPEDRRVVLVAALFLVLGAVWLGSPAHYHGDERYYTDAALRMIERHDPWTPLYASGAARLNKPLVTYWVVIATFATAGVSLFLARLPFLIAGALLVWLTGRLARVMFPREPAVALLAACILAGDVEIVTLARRSTPDILLVLAATATLYGLARILVAREAGPAPRAWLWIGAGLAVATKGGLGLAVIAFAFVAAFFVRGSVMRGSAMRGSVNDVGAISRARAVRMRELVSPIPVLLGVAIALAGLLPGFLAHASATGPTLFEDQVSARLAGSPSAALHQIASYAGSLAKHFAPWIVMLALGCVAARGALRERWRTHRRAFVLALTWTALLLVVFGLANTHRGRYLAPAHPILACAVAAWLHDVVDSPLVRRTVLALVVALAGVATATMLALLRADTATAISVGIVMVAVLVGWNFQADHSRGLRALAIGLLAASAVGAEAVRALVDPSPVSAACARMTSAGSSSPATAGFFESTASQMRVVSGARLDPLVLPADVHASDLARFDSVLAPESARPALALAHMRVDVVGQIAPDLTVADAWRWLTAPDPRAWLARRGEPVILGLR